MKKRFTGILLAILLVCVPMCTGCGNQKDPFSKWNKNAASLKALQTFVEDVTNEKSSDFVPEEDRIAVFDMDGTLYGEKAPIYVEWWMYAYRVLEDPACQATEAQKKVGEKIMKAVETGKIPEELEEEHANAQAEVFAGMTLEEYDRYVKDFIAGKAIGFGDLCLNQMWYQPMIEVVDYLTDHAFTVYICSGTDRFMVRSMAEGMFKDLPADRIIGMDVTLEGSEQDRADGLDYEYTRKDQVIRGDELLVKNVKANKVAQMAQEIGRKPILSFGNSSGDTSMAMYVTTDNPYKSDAFMLIADDTERENGNPEKAAELKQKWNDFGWNVISMKNDFATIYGEGITFDGNK